MSRKLKIASDSSLPRAKAFATDVADCHSCLQQHSVLQNSIRLKDEENMEKNAADGNVETLCGPQTAASPLAHHFAR